jgi:hypothetical protein
LKRNLLFNSKGISVLFLIIAMMLMVTIGYVFSYLIPSKQKSVIFPIQSTQAFFIAQSGVEFAVRYAITQTPPWNTPAQLAGLTNVTKNLGAGRFTLTYTNVAPNLDTLISVGEVPSGTERRRIRISNFTCFLQTQVLKIDPDSQAPCFITQRRSARFYIKNVGCSNVTLNAFSASWDETADRKITRITMTLGATTNTVFTGSYDSGLMNFNPAGNTQTIGPNQVIGVDVEWSGNISNNSNTNFYFYDTGGNMYTFAFILSQ